MTVMKSSRTSQTKKILEFLFAVVVIVLFCAVPDVYACQCRDREPPCAQYSISDAVFTGLVKTIGSTESGPQKIIHFNVERVFFGVSSGTADLVSSGSSCDYEFTEGKRYLVYAFRNGERNELYTHYCTRTTEISKADADLVYIKKVFELGQPVLLAVGRSFRID
jgi:hypothetical protein